MEVRVLCERVVLDYAADQRHWRLIVVVPTGGLPIDEAACA